MKYQSQNSWRSVRKFKPVDLKDVFVDVRARQNLSLKPSSTDKLHLKLDCIRQFLSRRNSLERRGSVSDRRIVSVNTSGVESYRRRESESA